MSYIVTNKWLRAGYGEPLRAYLADETVLEEIVDFGHAPIFPDADVFPCVFLLRKPDKGAGDTNGGVRVAEFPREALGEIGIEPFVEEHGYTVPRGRFGKAAWSLEPQPVEDLMEKMRQAVPLAEFAGVKPYRGVLTGLNEAFLIDTPTKERLVREDPNSAEIIKPYLRGQDIKRWSPAWNGLWMILLKSSGDHSWPWSAAAHSAEEVFRTTYPSLYGHMKPFEEKLRKRNDKGRHWWELRSCAYYDAFEAPKIVYPDITWRSHFNLDTQEHFFNNTVYFLSTDSAWLLTVLNSPLMWWFCWREAVHGKDEALRYFTDFVQRIPIAPPTDEARAEADCAIGRLVAIAKAANETRREAVDWLRSEFGVDKPGQKLDDFASLDADDFVEEVRKRRPKGNRPLTPAVLKALRSGYSEIATPVREGRAEAAKLERRLSDLVNEAYGLTPEEVALMWTTAPPRTPRF